MGHPTRLPDPLDSVNLRKRHEAILKKTNGLTMKTESVADMAIRNIVFDIGGVLADFNVNGFLSAKGFDAPMIKRILKASVMTPYWGQFERGELTEEEIQKDAAPMAKMLELIREFDGLTIYRMRL